jgi:hypothetical protein
MYSKNAAENSRLNIPGNYSGNAFRYQMDSNEQTNSPQPAEIPGFYRRSVPPKTHTNTSPHLSFSPYDELPHKSEPETEQIEILENESDCVSEGCEQHCEVNACEDCENEEPRAIKAFDLKEHLPDGDDLLLLGLLILLIQNKGCEDLVLIILMLLLTK